MRHQWGDTDRHKLDMYARRRRGQGEATEWRIELLAVVAVVRVRPQAAALSIAIAALPT